MQGITDRLRPTNLKELRSFLGAVNQLNKFIPDLAAECFPFRNFLKKDAEWKWLPDHEKAFVNINNLVKKVVELTHFKRNRTLRIICDASKQGLGAVLQQNKENSWKPIAYASRYLTEFESKYSINELELLAVVWSVEHFKNYVYGIEFEIVSDHKALKIVLKANKSNKTFSSRLTRWVDRLLPFEFNVVHTPGRTLGMADYLSRHPSPYSGAVIKSEQMFNDWFTINVVNELENELEETIMRNAKKRTNFVSQPISQSEARTRVFTVSEQDASSLLNAKTNKSGKIDIYAYNELMAANSRISQVYVQANYEKDPKPRFLPNCSSSVPLEGKIQFVKSRFEQLTLPRRKASHPERYEGKYAHSNPLRPCWQRCHAEGSGRRVVAKNLP